VLLFYLGITKLLTKSNSIKLENAILEYNLFSFSFFMN